MGHIARVYVGSWEGGNGISVLSADDEGGLHEAAAPVPVPAATFLVAHPRLPLLYAVSSLVDGAVVALAPGPDGSLRPFARQASGGAEPVHLAITDDGRYLACAHWGGAGVVSVLPLSDDGRPGPPSGLAAAPSDLNAQADDGARAHHVSVDGDEVTAVYFGADRLCGYRITSAGGLRPTWTAPASGAGSGPRHLARHPDGRRYISDELASTVSIYSRDPSSGALSYVRSRPATLVDPATFERNYPSEIVVSGDGRTVYVANRGPDTLAAFTVVGDDVERLDESPTGGAWPRHFAVGDGWLYVANERSDSVTTVRINRGGSVGAVVSTVRVAKPACVLVRPEPAA